jgi:hypothetical protein
LVQYVKEQLEISPSNLHVGAIIEYLLGYYLYPNKTVSTSSDPLKTVESLAKEENNRWIARVLRSSLLKGREDKIYKLYSGAFPPLEKGEPIDTVEPWKYLVLILHASYKIPENFAFEGLHKDYKAVEDAGNKVIPSVLLRGQTPASTMAKLLVLATLSIRPEQNTRAKNALNVNWIPYWVSLNQLVDARITELSRTVHAIQTENNQASEFPEEYLRIITTEINAC